MNRLIRNRDIFVIILLILIICLFNFHISHGDRAPNKAIPLIRNSFISKSNSIPEIINNSSNPVTVSHIVNQQNNDTNSSTVTEALTTPPIVENEKQVFFNEIISSKDYWKICSDSKSSKPNITVEETFFKSNSLIECPSGSFAVFSVISHIKNFGLREKIRQSWSSIRQLRDLKLTTLFFVYSEKSLTSSETAALKVENDQYYDVVYIPITHSLKSEINIYLKMLEFAVISCHAAENFVILNDGMFVNIPTLFEAILTNNDIKSAATEKRSLLMCKVKKNVIAIRNKKSTWFVSMKDWPLKHYPPHCDITNGIVMSQEVAKDLLMCSFFKNRFWINDVFLTGILPQTLSINVEPFLEDFSINAMKNQNIYDDLTRTLFLINGVPYNERIWRLLFTKSLRDL